MLKKSAICVVENKMRSSLPCSYLFVPGNRPERFDKAHAAGADAVIIDLEDAVAPAEKANARRRLAAWLSPNKPVLVRVNGADSEWFADDLTLAGLPSVAGIVLPKAERVEDIARCAAQHPVVLPLIESAAGFANLRALAQAPRVQRLVFGSIDFQVDLGMSCGEDELLPFRLQLVLETRLAGIAAPVDGVTTALDDIELTAADAHRAQRLGFGGKLCIHPRQVEPVHRGFMPSADEIAWAQRVAQAAVQAQGAATAVDGKMIDKPVISKAQAILDRASRR
jgi:citrate lyase subunit beta/citryl-CoA lyase